MGSTLSLGEAFETWQEDLVRYATVVVGPDDALDAVSQAFTNVLKFAGWQEVSDQRAYLFRATLNAALSMRRGTHRRRAREWRVRPAEIAHLELLGDPAVLAAVNTLTLRQRAVIYLTYWEDMTPAAVARALGMREGTVKAQLARGRARLREVLA